MHLWQNQIIPRTIKQSDTQTQVELVSKPTTYLNSNLKQSQYQQIHKLHSANPALLSMLNALEIDTTSSDDTSSNPSDILYNHSKNILPSDSDDSDISITSSNPNPEMLYTSNPKPISNLFMNHPHYNNNNDPYNDAMDEFLECLNNESKPNQIKIPTNTITTNIENPEYPSQIIQIIAAADNGSDIDAIGPKQIQHYKEKRLIKTHSTGVIIGTGNGPIHVTKYVPIVIINKLNKKYSTKFWCLESLPTHNFLLGRTSLQRLGWELVNKYDIWEHKPSNIDHVESELDELPCTNYPWKGEPKLDLTKIRIEDPELQTFIRAELEHYSEVIAKHEFDSGRLKLDPFRIKFIDEDHQYKKGFISKEYWTNKQQHIEIMKQLKGLIDHELIETCTNPKYVSPIFPVAKKTGDVRIVFDYRKLNEITQNIQFPMPNTEQLLRKFQDANYITSLDLKGGYWHCPIAEEDRHKTAFVYNGHIYQWRVMPFGPKNAPMFFQQCMNEIFGDLDYVTVYLDDISIISKTLKEHKAHLAEIFTRLSTFGLKLRLDKCLWGVDETEYLGFIVNKRGTKCKQSYIEKILNVPLPAKKSDLRRFVGLVQFLHRYIPQLQDTIAILSKLTANAQPNVIKWNATSKQAFNTLKKKIMNIEYLKHPEIDKPFHVFTDASKYGIGGMLAQMDDDGKAHPIAYCSKVFTDTQTRWHVSEQELYAAIYCVEKWSDLLRYKKFTLHTDHKNLQTLFNKSATFKSGKLFRWAVRLQDFHFECKYLPGVENVVADYLSRESVLLQKPENKIIQEFYNANTTNVTREQQSNNKGVDILKLYQHHLVLSTLMGTDPHYIHDYDPYAILQDTTYTNKSTILSPESHEFLNMSLHDQHELTRSKFKSNPKHIPTYNHMLQMQQNPNKIHFNSYFQNSNINISYPDQINHSYQYNTLPLLKPKDKSCIDIATDSESESDNDNEINQNQTDDNHQDTFNNTYDKLNHIPKSKPYVPPTDARRAHDQYTVEDKLGVTQSRTSDRLRKKAKYVYRHQPLVHSRAQPYKNAQLKHNKYLNNKREQKRKHIKSQNVSIIDNKPFEYVWNNDLLHPRYYVPILDDYGSFWDESQHIQTNLIKSKQWEDPFCFAITNFLDTGNKALIFDLPKYMQRYVLSGKFLLNEDKILCFRHTKKGDNHMYLPMLPASLIKSVLKRVHSKLHHGSDKMNRIIINNMKYWWPKMRLHIKAYCACCDTCQRRKASGISDRSYRGAIKAVSATRPFQQISTDIVGPLPTSHSGNRYIVTMIDKFSRYCMLVPTTDVTALSVVKAIDKWITTFGPPESILSDNGPQFISSIYRDYMQQHGNIKYKYTTTYHPQCNGQIERLHRWIKERLSCIAYDGSLNFVSGLDDWSDYLSVIQYTYNSTPNRMTTYSPMNIILGRDAYKLPKYKFDSNQPKAYTDYLIARQRVIYRDVNAKQLVYDEMRRKLQDKKKSNYKYQLFQRVLWNVNARHTGNRKKFGPKWIGPYEIISIYNDGQNYTLRPVKLPQDTYNNPLNQHKLPKRVIHLQNDDPLQQFNVPREQIKPYFPSFEQRFDGIQSPIKLTINTLTMSNISNTNDPYDPYYINPELSYKHIFQLNKQQNHYGCTILN